jgi:hypothetical protein
MDTYWNESGTFHSLVSDTAALSLCRTHCTSADNASLLKNTQQGDNPEKTDENHTSQNLSMTWLVFKLEDITWTEEYKLWHKLHFVEDKTDIMQHVLKTQ